MFDSTGSASDFLVKRAALLAESLFAYDKNTTIYFFFRMIRASATFKPEPSS